MDIMTKRWHRYHYKNLTYLAVGFLLAIFFSQSLTFHSLLRHLGNYGYLGAFIGGLLSVSTFSISIATVILLDLVKYLNPIEIALIAATGSVIGDLTIFQFVKKSELKEEIRDFFHHFGSDKLIHLVHTRYFSWTMPVIGALIIASPLPDDLGVSLMGISKMKTYQFLLLSFVFNLVGIFLLVSASIIIRS